MPPTAPLKHLGQESLTISTSALGITAALYANSVGNVVKATIQHIAGGDVYHSVSSTTQSNAGANGEKKSTVGDVWEVRNLEDIKLWKGIIASGEADATLQIELDGTD